MTNTEVGHRLADGLWSRDLRLVEKAFEVESGESADAVDCAGRADGGVGIRFRGAANVSSLQRALELSGIPTRVLIDLEEGASLEGATTDWLLENGFRVFAICREHQRWSRLDALDHDCDGRGSADALYAVRGVPVFAVSVFMHMTALGGAERSFLEWGADLIADGHLIHAYLPTLEGPLVALLEEAGISCSAHGTGWWVSVWEAGRWADAAGGVESVVSDLGRHRPDLVVSQTVVVPAGALAARATATPHVWWVHERPDPEYGLVAPTERWEDLGEAMWLLSDAVIANSRFVADSYWPAREVSIIAPIRVPTTQSQGSDARVRRPRERPRLGVVGSVTAGKGQSVVLDAVAALRSRGLDVDVRVSGTGPSEEIERLTAQAAERGIQDLVEWPAGWAAPSEIYDDLDAVVVASAGEGFGRVPVEAIEAGVPVVYADAGGLKEYMEDGGTGLAFEAGSASSLADALERLLTSDALRTRLSADALPRLIERLSPYDPRYRLPEVFDAMLKAHEADPASWAEESVPRLSIGAARAAIAGREAYQELVDRLHEVLDETREQWRLTGQELERQRLLLSASQDQVHLLRSRIRGLKAPVRRAAAAWRSARR